jgi:putative hydrolase of the HAD superfamily
MRLKHILFDLDDTLYRASSGLFNEIKRRMTAFVAAYFKVDAEQASAIRKDYAARYGTTLGGLVGEGGLADPEEFLTAVHPADVSPYIAPDPGLRAMLESLPLPRSIFTNSPLEHAQRVLAQLGVADCFPRIFDIRFCGFRGKPLPESYRSVLAALDLNINEVLFVDDASSYVKGYAELGGPVVQVREDGVAAGDWPCLRNIRELPGLLQTMSTV